MAPPRKTKKPTKKTPKKSISKKGKRQKPGKTKPIKRLCSNKAGPISSTRNKRNISSKSRKSTEADSYQVAEFTPGTKNDEGFQSFDKLTRNGHIKDTVYLGTLIRKDSGGNRFLYEFKLNDITFEGFSTKDAKKEVTYSQFEEGRSYAVGGTIYANDFDRKCSRASNSNFRYTINLVQVTNLIPTAMTSSDSAHSLESTFKELNDLIRAKKPFTRKIRNVKITGGDFRRYLGCPYCYRGSLKMNDRGKYSCTGCKKTIGANARKICLIILNLILEDHAGNSLERGGTLYHKQCETLLKSDFDHICEASKSDEDGIKAFKSILGTIVSITVKHTQVLRRKHKSHDKLRLLIEIDNITNEVHEKIEEDSSGWNAEHMKSEHGRPLGTICPCEKDEDDCEPEVVSSSDAKPCPKDSIILSDDSGYEGFFVDRNPSYKLVPTSKGYLGLVLIVNMNFKNSKTHLERRGAGNDVLALERVLPKMKIEIFGGKAFQDLNFDDFQSKLSEFKQELVKNNYSSSFVFIMSHGGLYQVRLSDNTIMNVYKHIVQEFGEKHFPKFNGKPKIFFFNACQYWVEGGVVENMEVDTTQVIADRFECFPCEPGFKAKRHSKKGSYFIQTLVKVFEENLDDGKMHLQEMIGEVQRRLSLLRFGENKDQVNLPRPIPMLFQYPFYFRASENNDNNEDLD